VKITIEAPTAEEAEAEAKQWPCDNFGAVTSRDAPLGARSLGWGCADPAHSVGVLAVVVLLVAGRYEGRCAEHRP